MSRSELLENLHRLHTQLVEEHNPDQETRKLLETVTDDIRRVLDENQGSDPEQDSESLSEAIRLMLIEFEARHPHLGGLLERITHGLSNMGI